MKLMITPYGKIKENLMINVTVETVAVGRIWCDDLIIRTMKTFKIRERS